MKYTFLFALLVIITLNSCEKETPPVTNPPAVTTCQYADSFKVFCQDTCYMAIPNAFTPNADGVNDLYQPISRNVSGYFLTIKKGTTVLFTTSSQNNGWNGRVNNVLQPAGIYTAEISGFLNSGMNANYTTCFYLAEYNTSNCIPKPTTGTPFVFVDQIDPITCSQLFASADDVCP